MNKEGLQQALDEASIVYGPNDSNKTLEALLLASQDPQAVLAAATVEKANQRGPFPDTDTAAIAAAKKVQDEQDKRNKEITKKALEESMRKEEAENVKREYRASLAQEIGIKVVITTADGKKYDLDLGLKQISGCMLTHQRIDPGPIKVALTKGLVDRFGVNYVSA